MFEIHAGAAAAPLSPRTLVVDDLITGAVIAVVPLDGTPSPSLWRRMLARWTVGWSAFYAGAGHHA